MTPTLMAVNVVSFSFSRCSTGGPAAQLSARWSATPYQQLLCTPNSVGVPEGPFGRAWLSLPHLIYNSVRSLTGTHQGPQGPFGLMWLYLLHLVPSPTLTGTVWLLSWLSYIIIQRPLSRLLEFWNRMLDRHQAEITVMQFTGHSLPVHQSMSVPWEFFYLVPFHQPISTHAISSHNCH